MRIEIKMIDFRSIEICLQFERSCEKEESSRQLLEPRSEKR